VGHWLTLPLSGGAGLSAIRAMDSISELSDELWQRRIVLPDYVYERETNQSVWLLELWIAE